jgi:hypothetical protein
MIVLIEATQLLIGFRTSGLYNVIHGNHYHIRSPSSIDYHFYTRPILLVNVCQ